MHEFTSRTDTRQFLADKLQVEEGQCVPAIDALLNVAADLSEDEGDPAGAGGGLEFRLGRWVIKDEDLDLLSLVKEAVMTLAGVKFVFLASLTTAAITSVLMAVVILVRNAYRNGAVLTPNQVALVIILKDNGQPMTATQVAVRAGGNWTTSSVEPTLQSLTAVPTHKGFAKFVESDANGNWMVAGI